MQGWLNYILPFFLLLLFASCSGVNGSFEPISIVVEEGKPFFHNYGLVKKPLNFVLLIPPSEENQILLIENPHINRIEMDFSKRDSKWILGDHMNFDTRPIQFRQFAIPIGSFDKSDTLFLQVDKSQESLSFGMKIISEKDFWEYQKQDDRLIGFLLGITVFSLVIGLVLMPGILSKKAIFFLLYIFLSLLWLLNDAGLFFQYVWPENPLFHSVSRGLFSTTSMFMFAFYVYQSNNERINKAIKKIFIASIIFIIIKLTFNFLLGLRIFPDYIKGYYISVNSITLTILFGLLIYLILKEFLKKSDNFFELGSIFFYCFYVFSQSLSEIGITLFRLPFLHQFDALIFIGLQIFFMTVHIKKEETRQKLNALKEFTDFQISQERLLKNRIIEVEEFERKRIAQNIHDDVGSVLAATKYHILALQKKLRTKDIQNDFISILELLDEGVKNQYSIIDDLNSNFDQGESLELALRKKIELIFSESGIVSEVVFLVPEDELSMHQKTQLFRIFTELITNTLKHGDGVTFVSIEMKDTRPIQITYSDDGKNTTIKVNSNGKGLENIKFRIDQLQGSILELKLNYGFRIVFQIPRANEKNITLPN